MRNVLHSAGGFEPLEQQYQRRELDRTWIREMPRQRNAFAIEALFGKRLLILDHSAAVCLFQLGEMFPRRQAFVDERPPLGIEMDDSALLLPVAG